MTIYIVSLLLSFIISSITTPFVKKIAIKYDFIDIPDERKIHAKPTPTIGGLAIGVSFFAVFFAGILYNPLFRSRLTNEHIWIFIGSILFLIVGVIDDKKKLSPLVKFVMQSLIVIIVILTRENHIYYLSNPLSKLIGPAKFELNFIWGGLINFIWIIFMVNAFNFIDGLDGLASGLGLIGASILFVISLMSSKILVAYYFIILIGSITGFARYNAYPAKIFLGDTGSMFIGYMLSTLSIVAEAKATVTLSFVFPLIVLGIPVYDTLTVLLKRTYAGKPIFSPDKGHFHHRLLRKGFSQKEAVLILYIFSIILGGITFLTVLFKNELVALICFIVSFFIIVFAEKVKK